MSALMTVGELARVLSARSVPAEMHGDGRVGFSSVSTDSRTLSAGALFVALSGERFDGHDYVARARENGAAAALVERRVDVDVPQLIVADSKRAFGLAAALLALAILIAGHRRCGQQRQNDSDADGCRDPGRRLRRKKSAGYARQSEQRHRCSVNAVAAVETASGGSV